MRNPDQSLLIPALFVIAAAPVQTAIGATYLSVEQAQRSLFPQATVFQQSTIDLSDEQRQALERSVSPQAGHGDLHIWVARKDQEVLGHIFVDEVIGREDFITYAVGIDARGRLLPVEILEYRESHGGEIRNPRWLAQFKDRTSLEQLRFGRDIKNIAGATLSSEHVTAGVRRVLALWQTAFAKVVSPATAPTP